MLSEETRRREEFRPGSPVRLGDGTVWFLPSPGPAREGPATAELAGLLDVLKTAEDRHEWCQVALSLSIYLLNQNYVLTPEDYQRLLNFRPDDPSGCDVYEAVERWVEETNSRPDTSLGPWTWRFLNRLKASWVTNVAARRLHAVGRTPAP
jgi:hypothetical protein